jgi:hypothetical protein
MKWKNVDNYHITSGSWTIGVYFNGDKVKYGLSNGNKNLGYFDSLDEAKANAK